MKSLDNEIVIDMNISDWYGYLVLMLILDTTTAVLDSADVQSMSLLSLQMYTFLLSLFFLSNKWKEKWLGKISISLFLIENSLLRGLNKWKILFSLLFTSIIEPLTFNHCLGVNFSSDRW